MKNYPEARGSHSAGQLERERARKVLEEGSKRSRRLEKRKAKAVRSSERRNRRRVEVPVETNQQQTRSKARRPVNQPVDEQLWKVLQRQIEVMDHEVAAVEISRQPSMLQRFAGAPNVSHRALVAARRLVFLLDRNRRRPMQTHNKLALREWLEWRDPEVLRPAPETPRPRPAEAQPTADEPAEPQAADREEPSAGSSMVLFGEGGTIRVDLSRGEGNEWISLNDLHRASGGDPAKQPAEWLRQAGTKRLISEHSGNSQSACFRVVTGGLNPGTWAHWLIATAYAEWLSPPFHLRVMGDWRRFNERKRAGFELETVKQVVETMIAPVASALTGLTNSLAQVQAQVLEQGDGKHLTQKNVSGLVASKKRCAELMVRTGRAGSMGSAHGHLQRELADRVQWAGPLRLLPPPLLPVAEDFFRRIQIELEREDARGRQTSFPAVETREPAPPIQPKHFSQKSEATQCAILASMHSQYADRLKLDGIDRPLATAWRISYEEWDRQSGKNVRARASERSDETGQRITPLEIIREDGDLVRFWEVVREFWEEKRRPKD